MNDVESPRTLAIVFVHGLMSDGKAWDDMERLVRADPALSDVELYRFEYRTSLLNRTITRRIPTLDDVADSLATYLKYTVSASDVLLATHSQGGLVALRLLARHVAQGPKEAGLPAIRSIVMFACPNAGSHFGWPVRRALLRKHAQERSLQPLDPTTAESIRTVLLATSRPPLDTLRILAVAGASDAIVSSTSARWFWPEVETVPGDHETVIRPTSAADPSFVILRHRVLEVAKSPVETSSPAADGAVAGDEYWLALADEVADRLFFDSWDQAIGGLVRASTALPSDVLGEMHQFGAWLLGRVYPPGHEELRKALNTLGAVLADLLETFNRHTETVHSEARNPWIRVPRWYKNGQWNPRYSEEADAYTAHINLLTDLTLELTRVVDWFCDIVRAEIAPSWRLVQGGFVLEGGPYGTGDTAYLRPVYTDEERQLSPSPYPGLRSFRESVRFTRDLHSRKGDDAAPEAAVGSDIQALEHELTAEHQAALESDLAVYRAWRNAGGREELVATLRLGMDSGLISRHGLRAPIWETDLHFRFSLDAADSLTIRIETDDQRVKFELNWGPGIAPQTVFRELDTAMRDLQEHLGPGLFSPVESIRTAAEALVFAAGYQAQRLNQGSQHFRSLIEYVDGWYIAETRLFPREHPYYVIDAERLDEQDWVEHVARKGPDWEGIHVAMRVAKGLLQMRP